MKNIVIYTERWTSGGIESFITNAIKNIPNKEYNISILTSQKESIIYDTELKKRNIEFKVIHKTIRNPIKRIFLNFRTLEKVLKNMEIDILHINVYNAIGLYYSYIAKKCGIKKIICHAHNTGFDNDRLKIKKLINTIFKCLFTDTNNIYISCSKKAAEFCFCLSKIKKLEIVKNGINTRKFAFDNEIRKKNRKLLNIKEDELLLGNIGRFVEQKNHSYLLDIFKEYLKINSKAKLLIIGSGKLKKQIMMKIKKYKIETNVIMMEPRKDISEIFQAIDIFVFPSKYEGLGIVTIEAQTSGAKCIVSDKIPKETKVTDNIIYLKIKKNNIKQWCNEIENNKNYIRTNCEKLVNKNGYNEKDVSTNLMNIYK